jgi:hypothetical protein
MHTQSIHFRVDAGLPDIFAEAVAIEGTGIKVLIEPPCAIVFHGPAQRFVEVLVHLPCFPACKYSSISRSAIG